MSDTEELSAELRLLADQAEISDERESEFSRTMNGAADALEALQARIDAVLATHVHKQVAISASSLGDVTYTQGCACGETWPCLTRRNLEGRTA